MTEYQCPSCNNRGVAERRDYKSLVCHFQGCNFCIGSHLLDKTLEFLEGEGVIKRLEHRQVSNHGSYDPRVVEDVMRFYYGLRQHRKPSEKV